MNHNNKCLMYEPSKTYTVAGSMPGPRIRNGTRTSNSNGKLFPLINPNCPKWYPWSDVYMMNVFSNSPRLFSSCNIRNCRNKFGHRKIIIRLIRWLFVMFTWYTLSTATSTLCNVCKRFVINKSVKRRWIGFIWGVTRNIHCLSGFGAWS